MYCPQNLAELLRLWLHTFYVPSFLPPSPSHSPISPFFPPLSFSSSPLLPPLLPLSFLKEGKWSILAKCGICKERKMQGKINWNLQRNEIARNGIWKEMDWKL